jgi:hypothetical protein
LGFNLPFWILLITRKKATRRHGINKTIKALQSRRSLLKNLYDFILILMEKATENRCLVQLFVPTIAVKRFVAGSRVQEESSQPCDSDQDPGAQPFVGLYDSLQDGWHGTLN